ncbi:Dolichyl-P-Man:Man(5)GlcNAc(2)-PP-dolichol alpha-1,3-mannosyltransferase [Purpureocillium takamizusanense]|uniref:Dol-P-Man:Man(5)GlcNAc(2)-PP-Dol alpha-1,3-mannosyltransferase n=1 Tax=Purpureocillium takamizusanense TaxID=2060973 RepID=A0A9Q8Q6J4_9HYPO|nr:Dolichyl-P-Man:Man(5)GlcNAc(2)-PP-dolichol alpha-1,3-mannosyltransferase [Purpureocillium takamizusanense]UNI13258.1 Dolichyl-P-Man:Man(5)GlcNAc(2)-PP-dolichol alpha-1,3-mannosyltransferase [Purpureocillium takamizusanense]
MSPPQPAPTHVQAWRFAMAIATGQHALSKLVPPALWCLDAVLCVLVLWKVPCMCPTMSPFALVHPLLLGSLFRPGLSLSLFLAWVVDESLCHRVQTSRHADHALPPPADTEIDWVAYMEQVAQYVGGERDYTRIEGGTGPLVYPAAHVYIYTGLYYLTDRGKSILLAQQLFAVLYMATLAVVMLSYWKAKVPPYIFPLLILSKRLHSVFILRCFNDCFAALFLWLAVYFFQRRHWTLGSLAYTWGLGIKMSLLLVLPAVAVLLFLGRGFRGSLRLAWLMAQVQMAIAVPFLAGNWRGYLGRAFELSRQFKFEWTVNWRMLGEDMFLSKGFALSLLAGHALVLAIFITTRWLRPADRPLSSLILALLKGKSPFSPAEELRVSSRVTPDYVMTTMLSANVIGLLFARSLHYQFYAYLAWSTPYLLWRAAPQPLLAIPLWLVQEWAWNVFPSTDASSTAVVNVLLVTVVLTYFGGSAKEEGEAEARKRASTDAKTK